MSYHTWFTVRGGTYCGLSSWAARCSEVHETKWLEFHCNLSRDSLNFVTNLVVFVPRNDVCLMMSKCHIKRAALKLTFCATLTKPLKKWRHFNTPSLKGSFKRCLKVIFSFIRQQHFTSKRKLQLTHLSDVAKCSIQGTLRSTSTKLLITLLFLFRCHVLLWCCYAFCPLPIAFLFLRLKKMLAIFHAAVILTTSCIWYDR